MVEIVITIFDTILGPIPIYSSLKDKTRAKIIARKTMGPFYTNENIQSDPDFFSTSIISLPDQNLKAFLAGFCLDKINSEGRHHLMILSLLTEVKHQKLLYENNEWLIRGAKTIKEILNTHYVPEKKLNKVVVQSLNRWKDEINSVKKEPTRKNVKVNFSFKIKKRTCDSSAVLSTIFKAMKEDSINSRESNDSCFLTELD